MKKVSIYDIAKKAGVSPAMVSRVVNNSGYVKKEKKEKILRLLKKYDYSPHPVARSLVSGRTNVIGVLIKYEGNEYVELFIPRILSGLSKFAREQNRSLMMIDYFPDKDPSYLDRYLSSLDGVILFDLRYSEKLVGYLKKQGKPFVLINEPAREKDEFAVTVNNWQGGYQAIKYLYEMGHRKIAMISGDLNLSSGRERYEGALKAAKELRLVIPPVWLRETTFTPDQARREIRQLMARRSRPTAIFVASDLMAFAVLGELKRMSLRVPQDVSVLGFDNSLIAALADPPLTTVSQPLEELGYRAFELLEEQFSSKKKVQGHNEVLGVEIVERESVLRLRR